MTLRPPLRRWVSGALLSLCAALFPEAAVGQGTAPTARLFFPPGVSGPFGVTQPIPVVLQLLGDPVFTVKGFADTDWLSLLYFAPQGGGAITATNPDLPEPFPVQCRRARVAAGQEVVLSPPLQVVPVETLNLPLEQSTADVRAVYGLTGVGTYTVTARIPFALVGPANVIDCIEGFVGNVVNVGPGAGFQGLTLVSNSLTFSVCCYTFVGFVSPLASEAACSVAPCLVAKVGRSVPVKFQLFLNGAIVKTAVSLISVEQLSGTPPPQPPTNLGGAAVPVNQFVFEEPTQHYHFNLETSVLAPGVWRIKVSVEDGSVHSALIQLD